MNSTRLLYSRKDAAQLLSIGVRKLDSLVTSGKIKAVRIGRSVKIAQEQLERFAKVGE